MNNLITIYKKLDDFNNIVSSSAFISPDDKILCNQLSSKIRAELENITNVPLKIGLLGGTGVGKSSIINHIAGNQISATSHRRPYTDRIIVYHHTSVSPCIVQENLRLSYVEHDNESVKQIIVFDMPDFDSIMEMNRETVRSFAQELDILLWVTSPEKYADRSMFDFIKNINKSKDNFLFVLNKIDLLSQNDTQKVIGQLNELLSRESLIPCPIMAVSALDASMKKNSVGSIAMDTLKSWVFKKRNEKECVSIKSSNFEHELISFIRSLTEKTDVSVTDTIISLVAEIKAEIKALTPKWQKNLLHVLYADVEQKIFHTLDIKSPSIWLVRCMMPLVKKIRVNIDKNPNGAFDMFESFFSSTDKHLCKLISRLPSSFQPITCSDSFNHYVAKKRNVDYTENTILGLSQLQKAGFLIRQWLFLVTPLIFFILYMLGVNQVSKIDELFQIHELAIRIGDLAFKMFSQDGVTALISLIVMECLISVRLASIGNDYLNKQTEQIYMLLAQHTYEEFTVHLYEDLSKTEQWALQNKLNYQRLMAL